jgi:hypothetical protein
MVVRLVSMKYQLKDEQVAIRMTLNNSTNFKRSPKNHALGRDSRSCLVRSVPIG